MQERMPTNALARLAPPPGGEQRLRAALHGQEAGHLHRGWGLPLAGALACLCVLAMVPTLRPAPMDGEIRHALNQAVAPFPAGGIRVSGADIESIESTDPDVHIYRLATGPGR